MHTLQTTVDSNSYHTEFFIIILHLFLQTKTKRQIMAIFYNKSIKHPYYCLFSPRFTEMQNILRTYKNKHFVDIKMIKIICPLIFTKQIISPLILCHSSTFCYAAFLKHGTNALHWCIILIAKKN